MLGVAPILPSRDLAATSGFYSRLGRLHGAPEDSDYGLREFALVDPDGNLLRIGSFIADPG